MAKRCVDRQRANRAYEAARMPLIFVHHDPTPTTGQHLVNAKFLAELWKFDHE